MSARNTAAIGIVLLLVGLLVGYLIWGRPTARLAGELESVKSRLAQESQRAAALQSELGDLKAEMGRLREALASERDLRQRLQDLVSKGKGS